MVPFSWELALAGVLAMAALVFIYSKFTGPEPEKGSAGPPSRLGGTTTAMWKMSVQWSLAENDATFRGGSGAGDDPFSDAAGDNYKAAAREVFSGWSASRSTARQIAAVLGPELLAATPGTPVDFTPVAGRFGAAKSMVTRTAELLAASGIIRQGGDGRYYAARPQALRIAGQLTLVASGTVPHDGPVREDCPLGCLVPVLPARIVKRLKWADDPPGTVGDLLGMLAADQLTEVRGLGPSSIRKISHALHQAGLDPVTHREKAAVEH